ncbi:endolytic transglycosylase MltG [Apibacter raozihei]|uniref:endolytic transglycosylase MltG n=1 Tax=Apibacter raozihei TaxID=2500547 RepID=UPI000FE3673F|nr:endolytic transglycosylase MltG [Apibacter raozihei]
MKKVFRLILVLICIGVIAGIFIGYPYYKKNYSSNISRNGIVFIPTHATYDQVRKILSPYLIDAASFDHSAHQSDLSKKVKAGKYKLLKGETNKEIIRKISLGLQEEVHLRLKSYDDVYELAGDLGKNLESDSITFINYFKSVAHQKGFSDVEQLKIFFTPDTYFMYWNTPPQEFFSRFDKMYTNFWTDQRIDQAQTLGLTRLEVYTLASIVQREYMKKDELPVIASLYLNRLKKGMKLQSDPTVIYAERKVKGFKVLIRRVKNLSVDSPYNTYKYKGLPPLPICMVNEFVIDAVLNPAKTDYLFMCAIENTGRHAFTSNADEHMRNARAYREWLDKRGIK